MNLDDIKIIYFVGIGGIGMSALARFFNQRGVQVFGYDRTETSLTKMLVEEGMTIHYEEDLRAIPEGVDLVVYTPAVPARHKELVFFREQGFPVKKRAEVLGIISRSTRTIAIAGTHGKTTTSSILTHLLVAGGLDCSAFLGGIMVNYGTNFIAGGSDWVVVEADEYDRSFLHLSPEIAVILSMDADHLDIYGDVASIHETGFKAFTKKLKPGGKLWVQKDWEEELSGFSGLRSFGIEKGDYYSKNVRVEDGWFVFDFESPKGRIEGLKFGLPGRHNVENATVAIAIAQELGLSAKAISDALASFKGIKRRFEFIIRRSDRVFINDYAHHPTELKAAIGAARELYPDEKLTGVFQPHLFSRTRDFADGFAEALDGLDEVYLLDIYPAREEPIPGVTSDLLFEKMQLQNKYRVQKSNLVQQLKKANPKILLTLGAGDIDAMVEDIGEELGVRG